MREGGREKERKEGRKGKRKEEGKGREGKGREGKRRDDPFPAWGTENVSPFPLFLLIFILLY
jgi:hypothetical protein